MARLVPAAKTVYSVPVAASADQDLALADFAEAACRARLRVLRENGCF
jgi:hypothetical protein